MTKAAKTLSYRQSASLKLAQLYNVARVMRDAGEILNAGRWLKVLANLLSAAPSGPIGKRRGRHAPDYWGLTYETLLVAAERCGLEVSEEEIEEQVFETQAWRHRESQRLGRPHYAQMRPGKIGELLGITDEVRREARADNIGTLGGSPQARAEARKAQDRTRDERRRREAGATPRDQSLSQLKPWGAEGISRRTWYRRQAENGPAPIPDPPQDGGLAQIPPHQIRAKGVAQIPLAQKTPHQISECGTDSSAPIIPHGLSPREFSSDVDVTPAKEPQPAEVASPSPAHDASKWDAAIARFRAIQGQPAPEYRMEPGGIAARALALVKRPQRAALAKAS